MCMAALTALLHGYAGARSVVPKPCMRLLRRWGAPLLAVAWGAATGYYIFAEPLRQAAEKQGRIPPQQADVGGAQVGVSSNASSRDSGGSSSSSSSSGAAAR